MSKNKQILYESERLYNFKELINYSAKLYSNKTAFKYKDANKENIIEKSYSQFKNDIDCLGTSLINLGLQNKKIILISPNRYEWCVSYLAITTGNMVVIPLDRSLPQKELIDSVIRSEAEVVIFDSKYLETFLNIKNNNVSSLKTYICMDEINVNDFYTIPELLETGKKLLSDGNTNFTEILVDGYKTSVLLFL